ncbi:CRISPR-associated protein Cas4 [Sporanaerobium hydrogeniformans]|uniref:CRISPR-associated protein Cas4 n=1 Tax=Sporanaerobium hydrogeniformans TaxID=3072179 RepID=A0AC61DIQ4_9FIRM|nr:CRISPR-associated protein Cas4 [Sporanaerobium hydrogeniformans]PHV72386.1 CRISPR-associated protein Cas4 [Sporanaerobium hydrogeniformans]
MKDLLAGSLLVCSVVALCWGLRPRWKMKNKRECGVPLASPIYSDEKGTHLLVAKQLELQGKPDYIFKTWLMRRYIPLEIKSGQLKEDFPHPGDMYQLAAYFLIIEEVYGKRPPYGKLVYANKTFTLRNTRKIRKEVLNIVGQMRQMLQKPRRMEVSPSFVKCKHCICRLTVCEYWEGEESE